MSEERVVHSSPDFFAIWTLSPAALFANSMVSVRHQFIASRLRIFLSGIIQKTGPFAAVDGKAKGKH
jgi:hypothetical protein